jgi:UTP-glucose-1-phosphate uridylyltransferase
MKVIFGGDLKELINIFNKCLELDKIIKEQEDNIKHIYNQYELEKQLEKQLERKINIMKKLEELMKEKEILQEQLACKELDIDILQKQLKMTQDNIDILEIAHNGDMIIHGNVKWDNLVTRLYIKGKDGLSIENLPTDKYHTYGKPYIECYKNKNMIVEKLFEKPDCDNIFELYAEAVAYLLSHCGK